MNKALWLLALVPSVILHEVAHGAVALIFGDDTAKRAGRLTLNPLRHVDGFGTLILPILLLLANAPVFGYAKPVPVDVSRLRNPRQQSLLVSLAGPATNIVLALAAAAGIRWFVGTIHLPSGEAIITSSTWRDLLVSVGMVNVVLAAFNLIPVPPLDGSAVVERLLPRSWWPGWLKFRQYSMGLVFILVLALPGVLSRVITPAIDLWTRLL